MLTKENTQTLVKAKETLNAEFQKESSREMRLLSS